MSSAAFEIAANVLIAGSAAGAALSVASKVRPIRPRC